MAVSAEPYQPPGEEGFKRYMPASLGCWLAAAIEEGYAVAPHTQVLCRLTVLSPADWAVAGPKQLACMLACCCNVALCASMSLCAAWLGLLRCTASRVQ